MVKLNYIFNFSINFRIFLRAFHKGMMSNKLNNNSNLKILGNFIKRYLPHFFFDLVYHNALR